MAVRPNGGILWSHWTSSQRIIRQKGLSDECRPSTVPLDQLPENHYTKVAVLSNGGLLRSHWTGCQRILTQRWRFDAMAAFYGAIGPAARASLDKSGCPTQWRPSTEPLNRLPENHYTKVAVLSNDGLLQSHWTSCQRIIRQKWLSYPMAAFCGAIAPAARESLDKSGCPTQWRPSTEPLDQLPENH